MCERAVILARAKVFRSRHVGQQCSRDGDFKKRLCTWSIVLFTSALHDPKRSHAVRGRNIAARFHSLTFDLAAGRASRSAPAPTPVILPTPPTCMAPVYPPSSVPSIRRLRSQEAAITTRAARATALVGACFSAARLEVETSEVRVAVAVQMRRRK